jgi:hypothetical protein
VKNFVGIAAVISPRKFCKVAVSKSSLQNCSVGKSASALRENALSEVARASSRRLGWQHHTTLQTAAFGKKHSEFSSKPPA